MWCSRVFFSSAAASARRRTSWQCSRACSRSASASSTAVASPLAPASSSRVSARMRRSSTSASSFPRRASCSTARRCDRTISSNPPAANAATAPCHSVSAAATSARAPSTVAVDRLVVDEVACLREPHGQVGVRGHAVVVSDPGRQFGSTRALGRGLSTGQHGVGRIDRGVGLGGTSFDHRQRAGQRVGMIGAVQHVMRGVGETVGEPMTAGRECPPGCRDRGRPERARQHPKRPGAPRRDGEPRRGPR